MPGRTSSVPSASSPLTVSRWRRGRTPALLLGAPPMADRKAPRVSDTLPRAGPSRWAPWRSSAVAMLSVTVEVPGVPAWHAPQQNATRVNPCHTEASTRMGRFPVRHPPQSRRCCPPWPGTYITGHRSAELGRCRLATVSATRPMRGRSYSMTCAPGRVSLWSGISP